MAPIKFEEHIKDKLEQRQLKPSATAWDRLGEKLDAEESTQTKNNWWWLGIAASVIVIIAIAFISRDEAKSPLQPIIVETPQEIIKTDDSQTIQNEVVASETPTKMEETVKNPIINEGSDNKLVEANNTRAESNSTKSVKEIIKTPTESVAEVSTEPTDDNTLIPEKQVEPLTLEQQKVQEVANKIRELQQNNSAVTEAEIEALLVEAQQELNLKNSYNQNTNTVDAMLLLQDVEFELDKSFRDKVFETLESGYAIVKSAVGDRDNN